MNWKMRALRVLPMFLLPALYFLSHSTLVRLMTMWKYMINPFPLLVEIFFTVHFLRILVVPLLLFLTRYHLSGDRKDQKTVERLRAERQAKIDELKERTNYYTTQQLKERSLSGFIHFMC